MSSKQKRWESVDKASILIETLVDRYLSACHSAGMTPKTLRGYHEKLKDTCASWMTLSATSGLLGIPLTQGEAISRLSLSAMPKCFQIRRRLRS